MRALGHVGDDYFVVVYTWREGNRKIISAWKVDEDGRKRYQEYSVDELKAMRAR